MKEKTEEIPNVATEGNIAENFGQTSRGTRRGKSVERTKKLVYIALSTALIVAMSQISIPLPSGVPLTLQTFAIAFAGFFLGWKFAFPAMLVYVALGAAGVPVFANFTGGAAKLVGLTGGFIWGFVVLAVLSGTGLNKKGAVPAVAMSTVGLIVCHLLGITQYSLVSGTAWGASALAVSLPFIAKDFFSLLLAYWISVAVGRRVKIKF